MGCDSQFDGYYDGERKARARNEAEMRRKVAKALYPDAAINNPRVDEFIAAVRAIIRADR
jgi:hypothetical protein